MMRRIGLFLLLLATIAYPSCIDNATEKVLGGQGMNIGIVIALMTMVIGSAYIIGSFLRNPNYLVYAKDEAFHLGFSVILLVAFSSIILFACSTMELFYGTLFPYLGLSSQCYGIGEGVHEVSTCYVEMVEDDARRLSESYIENYINYLMDSTFTYTIQIPLFNSVSSTAGAYKRVISNQYEIIFNTFLIPCLMSISMQKLVLDFVRENAIIWILPAAFLLRFFAPTRQMGNILIAFSAGIYILIPFMFVFNLAMYEAVLNDCTGSVEVMILKGGEEVPMTYADAVCDNAVDSYCKPTESTCTNPNSFWRVALLIPQAFFLPNLTIAIFITYLAAMDKALKVIG